MLKPNKKIYAIGLMSGTSTDGVDVACIELNSKKEITLLAFESYSYPDELKKRLLNIGNSGETTAAEISSLNVKVGTCFANSVLNLISKYHLEKLNLDFIGSHGQTISHTPKGGVYNNQILSPSTLQIGDPSIISELTGLTVISNMRTRDVAVGGTGAPLTPWAHQKLFENKNYPSAFLNLGGIANITFIPKAKDNGLFGFDCGPANMIIDRLVSSYTKNKKEFDFARIVEFTATKTTYSHDNKTRLLLLRVPRHPKTFFQFQLDAANSRFANGFCQERVLFRNCFQWLFRYDIAVGYS